MSLQVRIKSDLRIIKKKWRTRSVPFFFFEEKIVNLITISEFR